jgi:hypothetical protein
MIVNFKTREINRDIRKLVLTLTLIIIKKFNDETLPSFLLSTFIFQFYFVTCSLLFIKIILNKMDYTQAHSRQI